MSKNYILSLALLALPSIMAGAIQKTQFPELRTSLGPRAKVETNVSNMQGTPALVSTYPESSTIIRTLPADAEVKCYSRSTDGYDTYVDENGITQFSFPRDMGFAAEIAFCPNGDVYLKNPLSSFITESYVKGVLEGDRITISLPQAIELGNNVDGGVFYLDFYTVGTNLAAPTLEGDNRKVTYRIDEKTGVITMESDDIHTILGAGQPAVEGDAGWWYVGDYCQKYEPLTETVQTMPEEVKEDTWMFLSRTAMADYNFPLKGGFDNEGKYLYLKGIYDGLDDACLKIRLDGDRASLDTPQYMGVVQYHHVYALSCILAYEDVETDEGETVQDQVLTKTSNLLFSYDAATRKFTGASDEIFMLNFSKELFYDLAWYLKPTIQFYDPEADPQAPQKPLITTFAHFNPTALGGPRGYFQFEIYTKDVKGNLIDPDNVTYRIFFNDEPYMYYADQCVNLEEDTDEVGYSWTEPYLMYMDGMAHRLYFWEETYDITKAAVIAYNNVGGKQYASEAAVYDNIPTPSWAGVEAVAADAVETWYVDLLGRRVAEPQGVVIKNERLADGRVISRKMAIKK